MKPHTWEEPWVEQLNKRRNKMSNNQRLINWWVTIGLCFAIALSVALLFEIVDTKKDVAKLQQNVQKSFKSVVKVLNDHTDKLKK